MALINTWTCAFTGKIYADGDQRLAGRGQPPTTPNYPGEGVCAMKVARLDEASSTIDRNFDEPILGAGKRR